jgi:hypothetical protein
MSAIQLLRCDLMAAYSGPGHTADCYIHFVQIAVGIG